MLIFTLKCTANIFNLKFTFLNILWKPWTNYSQPHMTFITIGNHTHTQTDIYMCVCVCVYAKGEWKKFVVKNKGNG
jgi:hypothetical protein